MFLVNVPIAAVGLAAGAWLVPDSRNAGALAPDLTGTVMSITGIGLVLWAIIEGPVQGWSSPSVLGAGAAGLVVLAAFAAVERHSAHPMLPLGFFRDRAFGAAIPAVMTVAFGLFGALFVLTQFLQFSLGYSPLAAGVRVLPAAAAVVAIAPLSAVGVRFLSGSVVGAVGRQHAGVASATNTTAIQVGGAVGVAVVGSLLSTRYAGDITAALSQSAAGQHVPPAAMAAIQGSLGGALAVAGRLPGQAGQALAHAARGAFASGLDLGMLTAAGVAVAGLAIAVIWLPRRAR